MSTILSQVPEKNEGEQAAEIHWEKLKNSAIRTGGRTVTFNSVAAFAVSITSANLLPLDCRPEAICLRVRDDLQGQATVPRHSAFCQNPRCPAGDGRTQGNAHKHSRAEYDYLPLKHPKKFARRDTLPMQQTIPTRYRGRDARSMR